MWSDILFWTMVGVGVIIVVRALIEFFVDVAPDATLRDEQLEALIYAKHLQKDHFYLFVWDIRLLSQARCNDVRMMLAAKGIDSGFVRMRPGTPPVVYDLKRPEEPVKGIDNE